MRLKTSSAITFNISGKDSVTEVLYMEIHHYVYSKDFTKLEVSGTYYREVSGVKKPIVGVTSESNSPGFNHVLTSVEIDTLFPTLTPTKDPATEKRAYDEEVAYLAAKTITDAEWGTAWEIEE